MSENSATISVSANLRYDYQIKQLIMEKITYE